jgi:hypothetical protein
MIRSGQGDETLFINTTPGISQTVTLADGSVLETDARVVRVSQGVITMAGGTTAKLGGLAIARTLVSGKVTSSSVALSGISHGWFETETAIDSTSVVPGQILRIELPDGAKRGWTIDRVESLTTERSRIWVREDPGFLILAVDQKPAARNNTPQLAGPLAFEIDGVGRSANGKSR